MHLNTGFVGTAYLCQALTKAGLVKEAYTLLLQEDYPSWLYEVNMGATTVWERWNSVLPDGKISGTGMEQPEPLRLRGCFRMDLQKRLRHCAG